MREGLVKELGGGLNVKDKNKEKELRDDITHILNIYVEIQNKSKQTGRQKVLRKK